MQILKSINKKETQTLIWLQICSSHHERAIKSRETGPKVTLPAADLTNDMMSQKYTEYEF